MENKSPVPENINVFDRFFRYGVYDYVDHFRKYNHRGCTREEIILKFVNVLSVRAIDKQIERLLKREIIRRRVIKIDDWELVIFDIPRSVFK